MNDKLIGIWKEADVCMKLAFQHSPEEPAEKQKLYQDDQYSARDLN
jgi:hypothetical protein